MAVGASSRGALELSRHVREVRQMGKDHVWLAAEEDLRETRRVLCHAVFHVIPFVYVKKLS